MNIKQLLDTRKLQEHLQNGYITERKHPQLPLSILNYTPKATYENVWDDVTMTCRGLIVDDEGTIVARPFRKFFNENTEGFPETFIENFPTNEPLIMEKMDGSLGIFWEYDGCYGIATRGSFESAEAAWATDQLSTINVAPLIENSQNGLTPLFEIISPINRIVVDYTGRYGLYLLGLVGKVTGCEINYDSLVSIGASVGVPVCKAYRFENGWKDCFGHDEPNREGYVLTWRGYNTLKVKVKFDTYKRLHRLYHGASTRSILELLKNGQTVTSLTENAPKEFVEFVHSERDRLEDMLMSHIRGAFALYNSRPNTEERKAIALHFKAFPEVASIAFRILDGKDFMQAAWSAIERKLKEGRYTCWKFTRATAS